MTRDVFWKIRDTKGPYSQSYGFSSRHMWMWELDHKEGRALKNWCFWTVVLEKTLERPLDCKEIKPVHPKGIQSWLFIGRTDVKAKTPILWPPDAKNWLIRKKCDTGKDRGSRRRGQQRTRWLDDITDSMDMSLSKLWGAVEGEGTLSCCSSLVGKELAMTELLKNGQIALLLSIFANCYNLNKQLQKL